MAERTLHLIEEDLGETGDVWARAAVEAGTGEIEDLLQKHAEFEDFDAQR